MTYGEWLEQHPQDAANITKFESLGGSILDKDGCLDVAKIMKMGILMINHEDSGISITLV